ncbi:hypothetical protein N7448_010360 [Penicillium atrosanguineum]|nr:hypothetical protein N7448_010360 [Penicillium atrosanguineum]
MSSAPIRTAGSRHRRYKATLACITCRRRKLKCDRARPVCERCQKTKGPREEFKYVTPSSQSRVQPPLTPHLPTPSASTFSIPEPSDVHEDAIYENLNEIVGDDVNEFPSVVKSTINTRLGLPSCKKRCPIPLADAPMFGSLSILQDLGGEFNQTDDVLPPRKQADRLVYLYWHYLGPLELLLDEKQLHRSYETFFTGGELDGDAPARVNAITAEEKFKYDVLSPYLALTTSGGDTLGCWVIGTCSMPASNQSLSAVYQKSTPDEDDTGFSVLIKGFLVEMDLHNTGLGGAVCYWTEAYHGHSNGLRPPSQPHFPTLPNILKQADMILNLSVLFLNKMGKVDELTSYILSSQRSNSLTDSLGLLPLTPSSDSKVVSRLDACLTELKKELPLPILLNSSQNDAASGPLTLLHFRLSHARILLFRPMLARLCLSCSQTSDFVNGSLEYRMLQQCATLCIESARNMITLVHDSAVLDQHGIGVLPWWIRIFYFYIAIQHLIASMLRPDIFASTVPEAWGTAMCYGPLSQSVTRCMASFRSMWQKVIDIICQETLGQCSPPKVEDQVFQDFFEHLGFDIDLPTFDLDNAAWLGNVDWFI